jgi:hypothetical protein
MPRGYSIPIVDLAHETDRQVIVDRQAGQYLGHPTTVLLEDGKTMIAVYPKGHGRGAIVMKRSADGGQLCALLRENSRKFNSFVIFSSDDGKTWTAPRELPGALTGDRHTGRYAPDGRLFVSFRDTTHESPTWGDWVGWVGTYQDIVDGREGQYRVRLMDNLVKGDCAYPAVEVLPDGTFVTTTYGHWAEGEQPYIVSVRFKMADLDKLAAERRL